MKITSMLFSVKDLFLSLPYFYCLQRHSIDILYKRTMFPYKRGVKMAKPNQRAKILEYVESVYKENGYPPSLSEIATYLHLKSRTNIYYQLQQLCETGSLISSNGRYIPSSLYAGQKADVAMVPLLGTVAAGSPITAIESLEGYVAYLPRFR
jgi:SOS-response transcriptional repressor LexA